MPGLIFKKEGEPMSDKNKLLRSGGRSINPLIVAVIVIIVAWIIGKGVLTLISSVKQM